MLLCDFVHFVEPNRRRQLQSRQPARHGTRLWSLIVTMQSLITSQSGWASHSNLVWALVIQPVLFLLIGFAWLSRLYICFTISGVMDENGMEESDLSPRLLNSIFFLPIFCLVYELGGTISLQSRTSNFISVPFPITFYYWVCFLFFFGLNLFHEIWGSSCICCGAAIAI